MNSLGFRIVPLPTEIAEAARHRVEAGAADHAIRIADSAAGYPCRHCLRWAKEGERMILFPHAAVPPGHAYSETGPIFVHTDPCKRYAGVTDYPPDFRQGRVMRAYNSKFDIIDAQVVNGSEPENVIEELFQDPETAFVDVRSVTHGCYTFRIERA